MRPLARVVWSEGMHLAQHHFQAQNAYFEGIASATLSTLFYAPYGLLTIQLDEEALLNGTAALVSAQGILPDGLPFSFPEDAVPEPLRVGELFAPTQSSHMLLLALPAMSPDRANCALDAPARATTRFHAEERTVPDETTGYDARAVRLARKNFRLLLDIDVPEGMLTLPIARIQRNGAGGFRYDPGYVGPCLRLGANRYLGELVARILGMLESRAAAVTAERTASAGDRAEYASREIAGFWFLHALNTAMPALRHWRQTQAAHPEQLYVHLAQLAGALCTFSLTAQPGELPSYDHDAPERCFAALERHVQTHLDVFLPPATVTLALKRMGESFYSGDVTEPRCFEPGAHWFLGVRSNATPADVVARVKVCSAQIIEWLAQKAFAGMTLEHVPVPPPDLSPRIGMRYFALQRNLPCWKSLVETQRVGLYVPAAIAETELELKVVLGRPG